MNAASTTGKTRHASRVVRRRLKDSHHRLPVAVMARGLGYMMCLLRCRMGRTTAFIARQAGVPRQTLRDLERGRFKYYAYQNAAAVCCVLRGSLAHVEELTRRFLCHDLEREARLHRTEAGWKYQLPWSKNRANPPRLRWKRRNRARNTVFA